MPVTDNQLMNQFDVRYNKLFRALFFIVLILGLGLRFYQYLMGRSIWDDEAHMALNFMKYGYRRLSLPLDDLQAAPILYIYATKTFGLLFNYAEAALRSVAFIFSVCTLPLFYYIILELTKKPALAVLGFFMFAVNLALIYFSSELKPYGVDVSVYLLLVYLAVSQHAFVARNRTLLLIVAGCLAILFSNVSFIVLFCIGCYKLLGWIRERSVNLADLKIFVCWGVVFAVNYFLFINDHPSTKYQRELYAFALCPTDVLSAEFVAFVKKTVEETFFTMLLYVSKAYGFAYLLLFIFLVALCHLIFRKQFAILIFTCLPILLHLGLSAMKLYPFWFRLILYLVPCFIFLIAVGTYQIADFLRRRVHLAVGTAFFLTCCFFLTYRSLAKFPLWDREIMPHVRFINEASPVHVYCTDPANALKYYYMRGIARDSVHQELSWWVSPTDFYELTSEEKKPFVLLYSTIFQYGYGAMLEDLKRRNLVIKNLEYKGYGVSLIKPLRTTPDSADLVLDYSFFGPPASYPKEKILRLWGGETSARPIFMNAGRYLLTIASKGTPVKGEYPHLNISANGYQFCDFYNTPDYSRVTFPLELSRDTMVTFRIAMENDAEEGGEDRNSFIHKIYIRKDSTPRVP